MDKSKYPPQPCKHCGASAQFDALVVNCNRRYEYQYKCSTCKKRMVVVGPSQEDLKNLNNEKRKEALINYANKKTTDVSL